MIGFKIKLFNFWDDTDLEFKRNRPIIRVLKNLFQLYRLSMNRVVDLLQRIVLVCFRKEREKMSIIGAYIVPHPPIILPEIGNGQEHEIQRTIDAYQEVASRIADMKPQTIVLISPHSAMYADYFHISPGDKARGDMRQFGAPDLEVHAMYDTDFVRELSSAAQKAGLPAGTLGERNKRLDHGTMIPLCFINFYDTTYRLVRIGLSGLSPLDHYQFGKCISQTAEILNRRTVLVASGDLSHKLKESGPYGFSPEGPEFDAQVTDAIATGNFLRFLQFDEAFCDAAAECGLRSFQIMAGALDGRAVTSELLSYEGPFGVGYSVAAFSIVGRDENRCFDRIYEKEQKAFVERAKEEEDSYVRLARYALETYIKTGKRAERPKDLPEELITRAAGVFVSLKKSGQLRGCIGTIEPDSNCIADEILHNAVSAGTQDPRFDPVTEQELDQLIYSVDVLGEAEPVDTITELDAKRYGVIVSKGWRRGLLLPNLEGVSTPEQQISIALQKAGIHPSDAYKIQRFEVVRHK